MPVSKGPSARNDVQTCTLGGCNPATPRHMCRAVPVQAAIVVSAVICIVWTLIAPDREASWEMLRQDLRANIEVLDDAKVRRRACMLTCNKYCFDTGSTSLALVLCLRPAQMAVLKRSRASISALSDHHKASQKRCRTRTRRCQFPHVLGTVPFY